MVRPNRGYFKKAGNLRHGFQISSSDFIAIFDADFRPRADFLNELLPYMAQDDRLGIVQSPQYFDVRSEQNWLERGAGAVQELFYRYAQVSRESVGGAICVGSNAVYRRAALNETGGTALIEHSEDVHTGFNLRIHGWKLRYVPVILAKGLCPSSMLAFFKQQYRWCLGSMSLLSSEKFWRLDMPLRTRMAYISGFLYYVHTAVSSFFVPIVPISMLLFYHQQVVLLNYLLILPSVLYMYLVFPFWHHAVYGMEAWAVRTVYGWAHFFAIRDAVLQSHMEWKPTGSKMAFDIRYLSFRVLQVIFGVLPAFGWVGLATWRLVRSDEPLVFVPILISGFFYLFITMKVALYADSYQLRSLLPVRKERVSLAEEQEITLA